MTENEVLKILDRVQSDITSLRRQLCQKKDNSGWQTFGEITRAHGWSRDKLNRAIRRGEVQVKPVSRCHYEYRLTKVS